MSTTPRYVANFDSATAMHRALASYLQGRDFPGIGINPPWLEPVARGDEPAEPPNPGAVLQLERLVGGDS